MAVRLSYLYRDASNYKARATAIFAGTLNPTDRALIASKLALSFDGDSFIPTQVGLDMLHSQFPGLWPDDHPWHELVLDDDVDEVPAEATHGTWDEHLKLWRAVDVWDDSWSPAGAVADGTAHWSAEATSRAA
jgi:hypothetical protein